MAKTVKFKSKSKGLDSIIGDMLVNSVKSLLSKKENPKGKVSAAKKTETVEKKTEQRYPSKLERLNIAVNSPKKVKLSSGELREVMKKAAAYDALNVKEKPERNSEETPAGKPSTQTKSSQILNNKNTYREPFEIVDGPPMDVEYPESAPIVTPPPEKKEKPYIAFDNLKKMPVRTSFGEYTHPYYSAGKMFNHKAEPHVGPVKYLTTLNHKGHPLVQPIDDSGNDTKKTFQADPKNLTELDD